MYDGSVRVKKNKKDAKDFYASIYYDVYPPEDDVEEGDDRDEETGEPKDLYYHKMDSPFFPKFDED